MARGLYFALPTMSEFFLLFLWVVIIMQRQEYLVECQKCRISLSSFCCSNHLFFFSFLFPATPLLHLHIFRSSPRFILKVHSLQTVFHAGDPLLPFPKGPLSQKILYRTSPIGSIFCIFRKISFIFSSVRPFD